MLSTYTMNLYAPLMPYGVCKRPFYLFNYNYCITYNYFFLKACIGPPLLSHARLIGPPDKLTLIGKTRKYKCEKDYFETGLVEVICNPDLTWQETGFRCKGIDSNKFV